MPYRHANTLASRSLLRRVGGCPHTIHPLSGVGRTTRTAGHLPLLQKCSGLGSAAPGCRAAGQKGYFHVSWHFILSPSVWGLVPVATKVSLWVQAGMEDSSVRENSALTYSLTVVQSVELCAATRSVITQTLVARSLSGPYVSGVCFDHWSSLRGRTFLSLSVCCDGKVPRFKER